MSQMMSSFRSLTCGHALYVKDDRLHDGYDLFGMTGQKIDGTQDIPACGHLILSAASDEDGGDWPGLSAGLLSLCRPQEAGEGRSRPSRACSPSPARAGASRVTAASQSPATPDGSAHHFAVGTIKRVAVDISGDPAPTSSARPGPCSRGNKAPD
jgi:hypothetical protein